MHTATWILCLSSFLCLAGCEATPGQGDPDSESVPGDPGENPDDPDAPADPDDPVADGPEVETLPWLEIPMQAVRLSDNNGSSTAPITPAQVSAWVGETNEILAGAHIRVVFDPANDWGELAITSLNSLVHSDLLNNTAEYFDAVDLGNDLTLLWPDKMVVYFRDQPAGSVAELTDQFPREKWDTHYDFVAAPGYDQASKCGSHDPHALAFAIGSYLGLHELAPVVASQAAAANTMEILERDPLIRSKPDGFDSDGLDDTPGSVVYPSLVCSSATEVLLSNTLVPLGRDNMMSWLASDTKTISPKQAFTMRQTWLLRSGGDISNLIAGGEVIDLKPSPVQPLQRIISVGTYKFLADELGATLDFSQNGVDLSFGAETEGRYRVYIAVWEKAWALGEYELSVNGEVSAEVLGGDRRQDHVELVDLGVHALGASNTVTIGNLIDLEATVPSYGYHQHFIHVDYLVLVPEP